MLDVSQSAQSVSRKSISRCPLEYPLEHPHEYRYRHINKGLATKGQIFAGLGASAPFGAGADESASLRLIKTGRLPICKRPPHQLGPHFHPQVIHIEWLIRT